MIRSKGSGRPETRSGANEGNGGEEAKSKKKPEGGRRRGRERSPTESRRGSRGKMSKGGGSKDIFNKRINKPIKYISLIL